MGKRKGRGKGREMSNACRLCLQMKKGINTGKKEMQKGGRMDRTGGTKTDLGFEGFPRAATR